jgi:type IV pilus assembly protein PilW
VNLIPLKQFPAKQHTSCAAAHGFTIVELMVAMVLALLIIAAVGSLYVTSKQSFRVQDNSTGIDEVMRALEEDVARDVRKAGYFGCFRWKTGVVNPYGLTAKTPLSSAGKYPIPMDGTVVKLGPKYDIRGGTATTTTISPLPTTITLIPGSEYLSVSYGQPQAFLKQLMDSGADAFQLNRSINVESGQPLLVTNCDALTLFRADQKGPRSDIAHDPDAGDNVPIATANGAYTAIYAPGATLLSLRSSVFFLGQKAGDPPTLYVLAPDNPSGSAQPLAANVEQFNLLYGLDTGDGSLDFVSASVVNNDESTFPTDPAKGWQAVRAVRVGLVTRSDNDSVSGTAANVGVNFTWDATNGRYTPNNTASDGRLRKAHVFTVAIRGRSPSI